MSEWQITFEICSLRRFSAKEDPSLYLSSRHYSEDFAHHADVLNRQLHKRYFEYHVKLEILFDLLALGGVAAVWMYGIQQAATSQISLGDLALVFQVSQQAQGQLRDLISALGDMCMSNSLFVNRFFSFMQIKPSTIEGALTRATKSTRRFSLKREISLRQCVVSVSRIGRVSADQCVVRYSGGKTYSCRR